MKLMVVLSDLTHYLAFKQVCQSAEDYQAYDGELGLCVCREPPVRASSCTAGQCRRGQAAELALKCLSSGEVQVVWRERVSGGRIKEICM